MARNEVDEKKDHDNVSIEIDYVCSSQHLGTN